MANILLVAAEYEPFQASGVNRLVFFKKFLEQSGHKVFVLSTITSAQGMQENRQFDEANNIHRALSLSLIARRILSSRRLPLYPYFSSKGKYEVWIPFAVTKGRKLIDKHNIDYVLTSFPDFASLDVAEQISRITATPLITDFRDPPFWIYDEVAQSKKLVTCQKLIKRVVEQSDSVIVCTEQSKKSLSEYYQITKPVKIIANGYDEDVLSALEQNTEKQSIKFEIVHIGSFYNEGRDVKPVIKVIEDYCANNNKSLVLRLIGDEPDSSTLSYIKNTAKSFTVSIEPPLPMAMALNIAKNANALLLLQGTRFDRQIPTKVYEYLALNVPVWAVIGAKGASRALLSEFPENVVYSDYDDLKDIGFGLNNLISYEAQLVDVSSLSRQSQAHHLLTIIK